MAKRSRDPAAPDGAETDPLLSREAFKTAVRDAADGSCVLCGGAGSDAHHVLDRKLFPDGGYRLSNGAWVCGPCHWLCETTEIDVETVRRAAGIAAPALPPGVRPGQAVDKWGNVIEEDGTRTPGPLARDDGCRRALSKGGRLHLLRTA